MSRRPRCWNFLTAWILWTPCTAGCAGWIALAVRDEPGLDLFLYTLAAGVGVLALIGLRRWPQAALFAILLAPPVWHFAVSLPATDRLVRAPSGAQVAVEGTIRDRWSTRDVKGAVTVGVLLGEARVILQQHDWLLAEVVVEFPERSAWTFTAGRELRLAGPLLAAQRIRHRLSISFLDADWHFMSEPYDPRGFEALRMRLKARGAFHLSRSAQAVYLPLVLDLRDRNSPEGRDVIGTFRRVGISHLFAISGLNIAMIFGLLMVVQRYVTWVLSPGQGWIHGRTGARIAIVALVWAYIALIGSPVTAVRAAIMGSMIIWTDLWGTRTSGLYVLILTGMAMLALRPSALYDISFQLSFLAYFFLVAAMALDRALRPLGRALLRAVAGDPPRRRSRLPHGVRRTVREVLISRCGGVARFSLENLWVTGVVTLGLWPLIAARFHNLSLLVFAGNLFLVPAMELALLPIAMLAMCVSAAVAGAAPDIWAERCVYGALEWGLDLWVRAVNLMDRLGGKLQLRIDLHWSAWTFAIYYAALLGALHGSVLLARWIRLRLPARFAE